VVVVAEIQKLFTSELGAIVRDDAVGDPKAMNNVGEEEHSLLGPDAGVRASLDPLREFFDCDEQVGEAASCPSQGSDKVEPPDGKRPCDGDSLQGMCRKMGLPRIVLTTLAGAYQLDSIGDRGRPIESLSKGISDEGSRCCVVAASPRVKIAE
jgi:hypothetical protein